MAYWVVVDSDGDAIALQGDRGPPGVKGSRGVASRNGIEAHAEKCDSGDTGCVGQQESAGPQGNTGPTGVQCPPGILGPVLQSEGKT